MEVLFFIVFLLLLPVCSLSQAQPKRNIALGSSLSSLNNNSWTSSSGEFAFGFSTVSGNLFVGIWFEKIPGKPLVWTADRDKPAPNGSIIEFTTNGRLILKDQSNRLLMTIADNSDGSVNSAAMLDNGNFIMQSSSSELKWQSFDNPTDTILPGQFVNPETSLYSASSPTNLSKGRYYLTMKSDGNLGLYWFGSPTDVNNVVYESKTTGIGGRLVFNESRVIYVSFSNGSAQILTAFDRIPVPVQDFYQRATLDYDGVFRQYSYPKNSSSERAASWSVVWSTADNSCFVPGVCGLNGYCTLKDDQRADCLCTPGFDYIDAKNRLMGCQQNFPVQDCRAPTSDYILQTLENIDWPMGDFLQMNSVDEDRCKELCLSDCLCTVAIFRSSTCWKKKIPMYNGRIDVRLGSKVLIKMPRNNNSARLPPSSVNGGPGSVDYKDSKKLLPFIIVLCVVLGLSGILNLVCFVVFAIFRRCCRNNIQRPESGCTTLGMNLRSFAFKELEEATNGFNEKLGKGSFGTVYKGTIGSGDCRIPVAVKQLGNVLEDGEKEFKTEVTVIGRTHHKNLVQLLGFCDEGSHRLLVYEYMENGSLASFLFGDSRPEWSLRMKIAVGIARGLVYLHEECSTQIIHCDIKPENILVDCNMVPKISDFGLAKLLKNDQSHTTTNVRGTKGYIAPEWFRKMAIRAAVDVYSFGVILLEIICCRKNVDFNIEDQSDILVYWASDCFAKRQLGRLVEEDEAARSDMRNVERMVMVALWCVQEEPSARPTMRKVVQMLEGAVEVEVPPCKSSFASSYN